MSHSSRRPPLALAAALLSLAACSVGAGDSGDPAPAPSDPSAVRLRQAPKVRVATVVQRPIERVLETTAAVEAEGDLAVVAEVTGEVLAVLVEEGDAVEAGQVLARLERKDQEIAVAEAEIAVATALSDQDRADVSIREAEAGERTARLDLDQKRRDHDRNLELVKDSDVGVLSTQTVEASRLALDNAEEALRSAGLTLERAKLESGTAKTALARARLGEERARRDLERTELVAPIDGVVSLRSVEPGQSLALGATAFQITDIERLRVVFGRPQRELALFVGGADGTLDLSARAEALPGLRFRGEILRTSPTIDRASGSFRVTARLDPTSVAGEADGGLAQGHLLPGMLLRLFVVTGRHDDALVVPKRAVRREGASVFVLVVEDGVLRRVEVEEGYAEEDSVEVLPLLEGALADGDDVVVVGSRELEDGGAVEVERAAGEVPPAGAAEGGAAAAEDPEPAAGA